jgi:hypothetical protein
MALARVAVPVAVETSDRDVVADERVVAATLVGPVDCCGKRIGVTCWSSVGVTRAVADPPRILTPPSLEPPLSRCTPAGPIVSASIAGAATSSSNEWANLNVNMTVEVAF